TRRGAAGVVPTSPRALHIPALAAYVRGCVAPAGWTGVGCPPRRAGARTGRSGAAGTEAPLGPRGPSGGRQLLHRPLQVPRAGPGLDRARPDPLVAHGPGDGDEVSGGRSRCGTLVGLVIG